MRLRIGTRASALARAQAGGVAGALGARGHEVELVTMQVAGDRGAPASDKSRWVADLDAALLEGAVDAAVHSAKDVPGRLTEGLAIVCVPLRADPRDALCGAAGLDALPAATRIGTGSLRRGSQLRALREDVEVVELRGNVDTRLRKLADGECDALVLAMAGLQRLGREDELGDALAVLDPGQLLPACGQGALAVVARGDDRAVAAAFSTIDDPWSGLALRAERALVAALGADCHTPVGALAEVAEEGRLLRLRGYAGAVDGSAWVRDALAGPVSEPEALGETLARRMLAAGAGEVLSG